MSTKTTKTTKTSKSTKSKSSSAKRTSKAVEKELLAKEEPLDIQLTEDNAEENIDIKNVEPNEKINAEMTDKTSDKHSDKHKKEVAIKAPRIIPKEDEKPKKKRKRDKVVEIERFSPQVKVGLTNDQVLNRTREGLVNVVNSKNTKTYKSIIFGNIFTFFNLLCVLVAVALISVGAIGDCFFMIIVLANTGIGIIQEIKAKKTIEKISLVSSPTAVVITIAIYYLLSIVPNITIIK